MATFRQYPEPIIAVICNGPPTVLDLGTAEPDANTQLEVFGCQIFKYGLQPTVRLRINAYFSGALFASSEWFSVRDIETNPLFNATPYFYGWIRFTFEPRINFRLSGPTRFELELNNYTFSESSWIAAILDWPIQMGYNENPDQIGDAPVAMELYQAEPVK